MSADKIKAMIHKFYISSNQSIKLYFNSNKFNIYIYINIYFI